MIFICTQCAKKSNLKIDKIMGKMAVCPHCHYGSQWMEQQESKNMSELNRIGTRFPLWKNTIGCGHE